MKLFARVVAYCLAAFFFQFAAAQDYPSKPIRLLTSQIGGGSDIVARVIAQELSAGLGQSVIVDNRPAVVLGELIRRAPPNGYTFLVGGESLWIGPLLRKTAFDPEVDMVPLSVLVRSYNVLAVHPSVPVSSVSELIALAKSKPGELNYGSATLGAASHMAGELFKSLSGVNLTLVPHKGSGDLIAALVGGHVHLAFGSTTAMAPHVKSGKVRGLAVTSPTPTALMPGLPTVAATVPGYSSGGETAIFAPPKMHASIMTAIHRPVVEAMNRPHVKAAMLNAGHEVDATSPAGAAAWIKSERVRWARVIRDARITIE